MRFSRVVMAYLVIGVVMFGGGAVAWDNAGIAKWFVNNDNGDVEASGQASEELDGIGGALKSLVSQVAGPVVIIWNLAVGLVAFLNWPVVVLTSNNAPPMMVLILGVPLNASFYLSLLRLIRSSA